MRVWWLGQWRGRSQGTLGRLPHEATASAPVAFIPQNLNAGVWTPSTNLVPLLGAPAELGRNPTTDNRYLWFWRPLGGA